MSNNKNGYEIRTEILSMAKDLISEEYHSFRNNWEQTAARDATGRITDMNPPQFPTLDKVLETANQMYEFVNSAKK